MPPAIFQEHLPLAWYHGFYRCLLVWLFDSTSICNREVTTSFVSDHSPILLVVGDRAHSKFFSENVYDRAKEPKELYVVEDAEHIDLYDRVDRIPFDKLTEFFQENLK